MTTMKKTPIPAPYIKNFEQLGFGMFVHFGLYSQLEKGEWTYSLHKRTPEEYKPLSETFRVGSMRDIVETAKSAGCKYITLTTRHHEGFSLYDTKGLSDFDVMHSPTGRDLVREFTEECRKEDIVPFFYHTTLDWLHEDFNENFDRYLDYLYESVKILCTEYGKIGGLWFDGNWSKRGADWKEDRLYKMIHHYQPEAMIINNTGLSHRGEFG
jgi:alpha-L-fucosidase